MASEEHKFLADFVKRTHSVLREEARIHGPKEAWKRHVTREDDLKKYAESMRKLATSCWSRSDSDSARGTRSRVEWIKKECVEYFLEGGREKYEEREQSISRKMNGNLETLENYDFGKNDDKTKSRVKLLDVGSCYNPFGEEEMFEVTAIDLIGVPNKVVRCDFLNVRLENEETDWYDSKELSELPRNYFQVVVFSLFLEYLPCPRQRFECCKKAYELLQSGGVLFIITPDSKHVNANVRFMKSWRYALSRLGFMRIKYEKLKHIHCMIFRKCKIKEVAVRWADMQTFPSDDPLFSGGTSIYIPQDFRNSSDETEKSETISYRADDLLDAFNELPFDL